MEVLWRCDASGFWILTVLYFVVAPLVRLKISIIVEWVRLSLSWEALFLSLCPSLKRACYNSS